MLTARRLQYSAPATSIVTRSSRRITRPVSWRMIARRLSASTFGMPSALPGVLTAPILRWILCPSGSRQVPYQDAADLP